MWNKYEEQAKTNFKKSVAFFLFWIFSSVVSFANECPVQAFKQYAEKLDKTKVESIDRLKENYSQIASVQSSECRSLLFKDLRHYHNKIILKQAVSIEVKLNEIGYDNMQSEIKKYKAELYTIGMSVQQNEGYYFIIPNSAWYLEEFGSLLPDHWKIFLKQCAYEEENRLTDDAVLMISWEDLRIRVLFWEKFLDDYSCFVAEEVAEEYLLLYLSVYLDGTYNSAIYRYYDTKKIFPEVKESYESFIKLNSKSKYHDIVKRRYKIIKENGFIVDDKTIKKLNINYDCAKRILSMSKPDSEYFNASFECCRANTSIEKYICSDKKLADIDKEMGILYGYVKTYSPKKQKEVLLKKQRAWAKNRKKACYLPKKFIEDVKVVECLKDAYLNRIDEFNTIIDGESLELGPWYYTKRDFTDPFSGYYAEFYEVHSATTLKDSSIVENFLSIIKIKDPKTKNMYRVSGDFTCGNYHTCSIHNNNEMLAYIMMELKDEKLVFIQNFLDDEVCELSIEKKKHTLVISDKHNICTQYNFSCGAGCGLNGYEFKLKTTDEFAQNNTEEKLYPLKKDGKQGYVNIKGDWIIKPQDNAIEFLDANVTMVEVNGKKGIINAKGQWVIREYDEILHGQENLIVDINGWIKVKINGKWGVVNTDGKWIFNPQFDNVSSFTVQDQLTVKHNGKWGFIDIKGKWVLMPKYDDVYEFAENDATGFGRIIRNGKEGYVSDVDGLLLEPILDRDKYNPDLESIFILQKTGLLKIGSRYDKWGIIDRKGNWILKQKFDVVEILKDQIYVKFGEKEGYASLDGKFVSNEFHSEVHQGEDSRLYPFVCYGKKIKEDRGKITYWECIRSDVKCSSINRMHFGEYPNDIKAHEAFERCSEGDPKFIDPQGK